MQRWLQFIFLLMTASALAHVPERKLISQLDDLNQTLAASYRYDPYGNTTYSSGSLAAANVYRFSSKEVHLNSGLYSYGYRFYSPNWQRWLNQDPIGEWGGINLFGFVGNSPVNFVDPLGLELMYYYSQGGLLQPSGSTPYLMGENFGENLVSSVYNIIPVAANALERFFDPLTRLIHGAAEATEDAVTQITGAREAGEGARNLLYLGMVVLSKRCPPAAKTAPELTGQIHHGISRQVHKALEQHPNLKGVYQARDPRFVTQAKDAASHTGYQQWHRNLDAEVSGWVRNNPNATPQQFENYLRQRYSQPDLSGRFPNGL